MGNMARIKKGLNKDAGLVRVGMFEGSSVFIVVNNPAEGKEVARRFDRFLKRADMPSIYELYNVTFAVRDRAVKGQPLHPILEKMCN